MHADTALQQVDVFASAIETECRIGPIYNREI